MLPDQLTAFFAIALVFILFPGPNVLVIVSTSIAAGRARGLQTVAGTAGAMAVQLGIAALATSSLLLLLNEGLFWLKWIGVCYLLYLGFRCLFQCWHPTPTEGISAFGSFQRGFWVSLTNPKTILFFSAFLPQFVDNASAYLPQITVLSTGFWLMAVICDCSYAVLAAKLRWLLQNRKTDTLRIQNGLSGTLYLVAAGFLARLNR